MALDVLRLDYLTAPRSMLQQCFGHFDEIYILGFLLAVMVQLRYAMAEVWDNCPRPPARRAVFHFQYSDGMLCQFRCGGGAQELYYKGKKAGGFLPIDY